MERTLGGKPNPGRLVVNQTREITDSYREAYPGLDHYGGAGCEYLMLGAKGERYLFIGYREESGFWGTSSCAGSAAIATLMVEDGPRGAAWRAELGIEKTYSPTPVAVVDEAPSVISDVPGEPVEHRTDDNGSGISDGLLAVLALIVPLAILAGAALARRRS